MKIKKLFPDKQDSKKGLMEFLDKKGFYIVLLLCIAIVGTVAVVVTTYNITSPDADVDPQNIIADDGDIDVGLADENLADSSVNTDVAVNPKPTPANTNDGKNGTGKETSTDKQTANPTATPVKSAKASPTPVPNNQAFIVPVFGNTTQEYAQDKLVYSKTLEDWRTHSGIDLAADKGTAVKVVADGVVTDIKNDPRWGVVIVVDHQNGLKSLYANLNNADMVTPNQRVKQGETIGSIGSTAAFESAEQSHLHFEVWKNDKLVNPAGYLPKK